MILVAEGHSLSEIKYTGKGQLRIYYDHDLTLEELGMIEVPYRYDARILEIDFDGTPYLPSLLGVEGWQIFSDQKLDWAWVAVIGVIFALGAKHWRKKHGNDSRGAKHIRPGKV